MALLLAVDVSLSVDENEYALQMGGIAAALQDDRVRAAINTVPGGVTISVMQWSGRTDQAISLDWETVTNIDALSARIAKIPRSFSSSTAPGSALQVASRHHAANLDQCDRTVTDVSGDGVENDGTRTRAASQAAIQTGQTINGLVILGEEPRLENFYRHNVIGGPGHFLEIAAGFSDYQRAMTEKLLKEMPQQLAMGGTE